MSNYKLKLFLTVVGSLLISPVFAGSVGAYLNLENNCNRSLNFELSGDYAANYTLPSSSYITTQYLSAQAQNKYFLNVKNNDNYNLGSLEMLLFNNFTNNSVSFFGMSDFLDTNLMPNQNTFSWHGTPIAGSFVGTPTFTVTACPYKLDISSSNILNGVKRVLFFGDSLSDNGNLSKFDMGVLPKSTPYYNGMFSNGNVWSEQLKQALLAKGIDVSNYAVGGATSVFNLGLNMPYSLGGEYKLYQANSKSFAENPQQRLAFIFIGANDYLGAATNIPDVEIEKLTSSVVNDGIGKSINQLVANGIKKIIVIDLPDLGKTPECKELNNCQVENKISQLHNKKLKQLIEKYQNSDASIAFQFIDIAPLFDEIIQDKDNFNQRFNTRIKYTDKGCWTGGYTVNNNQLQLPVINAQIMGKTSELPKTYDILEAYRINNSSSASKCDNPSEYLFWDHVHPTYQVHKALFQYISEQIGSKIYN